MFFCVYKHGYNRKCAKTSIGNVVEDSFVSSADSAVRVAMSKVSAIT